MRATWERGLVLFFVLCPFLGCRGSTEVTVEIFTDLSCATFKGVTVTVGQTGQVESKPVVTSANSCEGTSGLRRVGSIVVVPTGGNDEEFAVKVVGGVDAFPEQCTPESKYAGCIVARRSMRFVPHTPLYLPVVLRGSCQDLPCGATTTCVGDSCVDAKVPDPDICFQPGACDEGVLTGIAGGDMTGGDVTTGAGGDMTTGKGGMGGMGGAGGAGGAAPKFPPASSFSDDFSSGSPAPNWGSSTENGCSFDGNATFTITGSQQFDCSYFSSGLYDLTGSFMSVRVPGLTNTALPLRVYLAAEDDAKNRVEVGYKATGPDTGVLYCTTANSGVYAAEAMGSYDPSIVLWRIRADGGTYFCESSTDGSSWSPIGTGSLLFSVTGVHARLGVRGDSGIGKQIGVTFDGYNVP